MGIGFDICADFDEITIRQKNNNKITISKNFSNLGILKPLINIKLKSLGYQNIYTEKY
jgi:hypothetical protein